MRKYLDVDEMIGHADKSQNLASEKGSTHSALV